MASSSKKEHPLVSNQAKALETLGKKVAEARIARGWTQRDLSERVGANEVSIRRLEQGETNISVVLFGRVAGALKESPAELLNDLKSEEELLDDAYEENRLEIEERTAAMGLRQLDHRSKKALLQLLGYWPRDGD